MRNALLIAALKLALLWAPPVFDIVREPSKPAAVPAPTPPATPIKAVPLAAPKVAQPERRLMFFTASWCGACPGTKRTVDRWREERRDLHGRVVVHVVDGDRHPGECRKYGVDVYPTLIVTERGRVVARHEGGLSRTDRIDALVGLPRACARKAKPSLPMSRSMLKPEFRNTERMRRHLVEDHGYTADQVRGMTREQLFSAHDEAHGEVLR